jgi:hypothetical protein
MFSTAKIVLPRIAGLGVACSLLLITACGRDELSLQVAHAAGSPARMAAEAPVVPKRIPVARALRVDTSYVDIRRTTEEIYRALPSQSCYAFMLRRPKVQQAAAVQARLQQADHMSAALDSDTFSVDLVGDHANVLSLEFPVVWPAVPNYAEKVSSVLVDYLSVPEIQDYLCNSGFAEVKLSAHGLNDGRSHLLWTAKVTSEGLIKTMANGKRQRLDELISPSE